jgi:hypothetical protein
MQDAAKTLGAGKSDDTKKYLRAFGRNEFMESQEP